MERDQEPGPISSWSQGFVLVWDLDPHLLIYRSRVFWGQVFSFAAKPSWKGRPLGRRPDWLSSLQKWREDNPSFRGG